jgi:hypothetical protein
MEPDVPAEILRSLMKPARPWQDACSAVWKKELEKGGSKNKKNTVFFLFKTTSKPTGCHQLFCEGGRPPNKSLWKNNLAARKVAHKSASKLRTTRKQQKKTSFYFPQLGSL